MKAGLTRRGAGRRAVSERSKS